ncbi:hypothetical protein ACHAPU_009238 [Fusarium lateritium]
MQPFTPRGGSFAPGADNSTPEANNYTPEADNYTPEADNYTPEANNYTPEADNYTPEGDSFIMPSRTAAKFSFIWLHATGDCWQSLYQSIDVSAGAGIRFLMPSARHVFLQGPVVVSVSGGRDWCSPEHEFMHPEIGDIVEWTKMSRSLKNLVDAIDHEARYVRRDHIIVVGFEEGCEIAMCYLLQMRPVGAFFGNCSYSSYMPCPTDIASLARTDACIASNSTRSTFLPDSTDVRRERVASFINIIFNKRKNHNSLITHDTSTPIFLMYPLENEEPQGVRGIDAHRQLLELGFRSEVHGWTSSCATAQGGAVAIMVSLMKQRNIGNKVDLLRYYVHRPIYGTRNCSHSLSSYRGDWIDMVF